MAGGLVQLYTGNGKGKTTAALGQALRAVGHGQNVYFLQFMKGNRRYGELTAVEGMAGFTLVQAGRDEFVDSRTPDPIDIELAAGGLSLARWAVFSGDYDMVVLDEINVALNFRLLSLGDVLELITSRPPSLDLILTGRYAPPELYQVADLVSEVREIKHHYRNGIEAREGIEY